MNTSKSISEALSAVYCTISFCKSIGVIGYTDDAIKHCAERYNVDTDDLKEYVYGFKSL